MGAGQIGGIATLLNIDFKNAAGFLGVEAENTEGQFVVNYLSHAMMFCVGAMLEPHVVLTPASCVFGERYKFEVFGGTHNFMQYAGLPRVVHHLCIHRGYNHSSRWERCSPDNLALLLLSQPYSFHKREGGSDFIMNRVRYGSSVTHGVDRFASTTCRFYGWGSRRNGYLIPLLVRLRRVDVTLLPQSNCDDIWDNEGKFLCMQQPSCKSGKFGALCPDDMGTLLVCSGYAQGMMVSRLVDRPCGVGFVDLTLYNKFLRCGVDDSRDVLNHDDFMEFEYTTAKFQSTNVLITPPVTHGGTLDVESDEAEATPAEKKTKSTKPTKPSDGEQESELSDLIESEEQDAAKPKPTKKRSGYLISDYNWEDHRQ